MKWYPKDVIALAALVILGACMAMGHDSIVTTLFAAIIAAYVGIDITLIRSKPQQPPAAPPASSDNHPHTEV